MPGSNVHPCQSNISAQVSGLRPGNLRRQRTRTTTARITTRARRAAAVSIGDHCRPVSGVAAEMGMDWNIPHEAFVAYAEQVLPAAPPPVRVLGLDETRRGKGRYEVVTSSTGVKVWVDRFDTGLVDLDGTGGLFAQVNGRNSAAVIAWLRAQDPAWRAPSGSWSPTIPTRPRRANRITGTNPADGTKLISSEVAATLGLWESFISGMTFLLGLM